MIRLTALALTFIVLCGCTSKPIVRSPQSVPANLHDDIAAILSVLATHVAPLDRDLYVFRYEETQNDRPNPRTERELFNRESLRMIRFYDPKIRTGDDVGPGIFTATDPTATATWGMNTPNLITLKLLKGFNVLSADTDNLNETDRVRIQALSDRYGCQSEADRKDRALTDYEELISTFRNSLKETCRVLITQAAQSLNLSAITYHFYSATYPECRTTGTAVNLIDPGAIDWEHANFYGYDGDRIEGDPELSQYVKKLYSQGIDDFTTQTYMHTRKLLAEFRKGFGYFKTFADPPANAFDLWKAQHIFKCGPKWSVESPSPMATLRLNALFTSDPEIQNLEINTYLAYSELIGSTVHGTYVENAGSEMSFQRLKSLAKYTYTSLGRQDKFRGFEEWWTHQSNSSLKKDLTEIEKNSHEINLDLIDALSQLLYNQNRAVAKIDPHDSKYLSSILANLGAGPHSLTYIYNFWQFSNGGVPYLVGLAPVNTNDDKSAERANSRAILKSILIKCLAVYSKPNITMQEVFASDCGVARDKS